MYPNPTPIKVGMEGSFAGKQYRVVGRVVMGIMEAGEIYFWNEFNLETDAGDVATLVYEEAENGPEWKMFTMFEPQFAISAEDAAAKRPGDVINLDGEDCNVTRVDHSRIYQVEGKGQEGEVVGAKADYFNARQGHKMVVVSWTGSEVECYHGINITSGMVAAAFNLQTDAFRLETGVASRFQYSGTTSSPGAGATVKALFAMAAVLVIWALIADGRPSGRAPSTTKIYTAPSSSFLLTGEGTISETPYRISEFAVVEIAEVGLRYQRHEYSLTNDDGGSALLIQGMPAGTKTWMLFKPLHPLDPMTPEQAARQVVGDVVNVDGVVALVTDLFRCKVIWEDDYTGQIAKKTGGVRYGFLGRKNETTLLVRWSVYGINFYQGTAVKESELKLFGRAVQNK